MNLLIKLILWGYGLFGALTALDALTPVNCLVNEQRYGAWYIIPTILLHYLLIRLYAQELEMVQAPEVKKIEQT